MSPTELARQISESAVGTALRESLILFPLIEGIHLLGLALSFGLIFFTDLRLIGVFLKQVPVSQILAQLRGWMQRRPVRLLCGLAVAGFGVVGLLRAASLAMPPWLAALCMSGGAP